MDIIILHRNLRLEDNSALFHGSVNQNYRVIYVYDKNYWKSYGRSSRQLKFAIDCLSELDKNLKQRIYISKKAIYSNLDFKFQDFSSIPENTLVFFDDHVNHIERMKESNFFKIKNIEFENINFINEDTLKNFFLMLEF